MSTDPGFWDSASMVSTSATSPRSASSGVKWVRQRVVVVNVDGEEPPHDAAAQTFEADTSDAPSHVTKLTMERNELSLKNEALQQQLAHARECARLTAERDVLSRRNDTLEEQLAQARRELMLMEKSKALAAQAVVVNGGDDDEDETDLGMDLLGCRGGAPMISTHDKDMVGSWMCCMAPPLADDDRDEFDADAARARAASARAGRDGRSLTRPDGATDADATAHTARMTARRRDSASSTTAAEGGGSPPLGSPGGSPLSHAKAGLAILRKQKAVAMQPPAASPPNAPSTPRTPASSAPASP